jgi:hypothetical protein
MRIRFVGSILFALALLAISTAIHAQTSATPGSAAATAIPDLSGNWAPHRPVPVTAETALCGIRTVCDDLLGAKGAAMAPMAEKPEEPEMQPWAEEKYNAVKQGKARDSNFTGCTPQSPTDLMLDNRRRYELRQFPDMVLILFDEDHLVRQIYLDGRGHPDGSQTTWMGHSTGKYEGATLVIDTVGFNDKNWIDREGHPHSEALHLVERIRRLNQNSLQYEVTIDDPKAYKTPWTRKMVQDALPAGFEMLEEDMCDELLQMGTHYSAKPGK